jgi:integrase
MRLLVVMRGGNVERQKRDYGSGGILTVKNSKNLYVQYYDDAGRQVRISCGSPSRQKAKEFLLQKLQARDTGTAPAAGSGKLCYGHLRAKLLSNYRAKQNKSLLTMKDGTEGVVGLRQLDEFMGYTPPDKMGMPLRRINTDLMRQFSNQRLEDGVGGAMINRSLAALRRMFRLAVKDHTLATVPWFEFQKEPEPRQGFVTPKEFESLLKWLPEYLKPLVCLLHFTGVRIGEAKKIRWDQVDLQARQIKLEGGQTKNSKPRTLPLDGRLVKLLSAAPSKSGLVFDSTNLRNEWQQAAVKAGLGTRKPMKSEAGFEWFEYRGLRVHDLRRTGVRNLRKAGVSETVAMKISGHKTADVFRRYDIVNTDDIMDAASKVENNHRQQISGEFGDDSSKEVNSKKRGKPRKH